MKKLSALAILGLATFGMAPQQASAGWFHCLCCCHKCDIKISCKQYNAFSPYCCDSLSGCLPLQGYAAACGNGGCSPAWSYAGDAGHIGELPAMSQAPGQAVQAAPIGAPQARMPMYAPQVPNAQAWQQWAPGMINPMAPAGNYPGFAANPGFNGLGR